MSGSRNRTSPQNQLSGKTCLSSVSPDGRVLVDGDTAAKSKPSSEGHMAPMRTLINDPGDATKSRQRPA